MLSRNRHVFNQHAEPAGGGAAPSQEFALSPQQRLYWQQHDADGTSGKRGLAFLLESPLDSDSFAAALELLNERHEILRCIYPLSDGGPVARILAQAAPQLVQVDVSGLGLDALRARVAESLQAPLELGQQVPFRWTLFLRDGKHAALSLQTHAVACDQASLATLIGELGAVYHSLCANQPLALAPITHSLAATLTPASTDDSAQQANLKAFWDQELAGELAVLNFQTDKPRPPVLPPLVEVLRWALPDALSQGLRKLAGKSEHGLYDLMLSATQVFLHRYTGQGEVLVAAVEQADAGGLLGPFERLFPCRGLFSGRTERLKDFRASQHKTLQKIRQHQDYPWASILADRGTSESDTSRMPMCQARFQWVQQNPGLVQAKDTTETWRAGGLVLLRLAVGPENSRFDLSFRVISNGDDLILEHEYNSALYQPATIKRMAANFHTLLNAMVEHPEAPLGQLEVLAPAEREELIFGRNQTKADYPRERCFYHLFEDHARRSPDKIAVMAGSDRISYGELNERANQVAHFLRAEGLGNENFVGVCMHRSVNMMVALIGILKAGAAYVPLDPAFPEDRLEYMVDDSQLRVLFTEDGLAEKIKNHSARVLHLDKEWSTISQNPKTNPKVPTDPTCRAYVIYTSGSTGKPKGVQISHLAFQNFIISMAEKPGIQASDVWLSVTTLSFDICGLELWGPMISGATIVLAPKEVTIDGPRLLDLLLACGATIMQATPVSWRLMLGAGWQPGRPLKMLCGGEPMPPELADQLVDRGELWNMYGPTETTVWSTLHRLANGKLPVSIGKPIANTDVFLIDSHFQLAPIGGAGELIIGGEGLARGYHNRPDLTALQFVPNPYTGIPGDRMYKTGDLARWLPSAALECFGRIDHQVKVRGFRIELGEIESAIIQHESVKQVVVIVREDSPGDKMLVAYVKTHDDAKLDVGSVRTFIREFLPEYMVPSAFVQMEVYPLTPNGKIDKKSLPAPDWSKIDLGGEYVAPRTEQEEVLASIWSQVLRVPKLSVKDSFHEYGGNSLHAVQLINRVREAFRVELPQNRFYKQPTIEGMSHLIDELRQGGEVELSTPIHRVEHQGHPRLSSNQHRLWYIDQLQPGNAAYNVPTVLRIRGRLDANILQKAVASVVARHSSLRTCIVVEGETPVQKIAANLAVEIELVDLTQLPEAERDGEAIARATRHGLTPFALDQWPLFRFTLYLLAEDAFVFLTNFHHTIYDGWSTGVFLSELRACYQHHLSGEALTLHDLPIEYADYSHWLRQDQEKHKARERAFWKQALEGAQTVLELPRDKSRPPEQLYAGALQNVQIPDGLAHALRTLARQQHTTLFTLLQTAFSTFLFRYTGLRDILVGTPMANRNHAETENLIGFFVNTVVLRTQMYDNPSFNKLLASVHESFTDTLSHQDFPFEGVVELLKPERDPSRNPLFQVMFVLHNNPLPKMEDASFSMEIVDVDRGFAQFDLTLVLTDNGDGLWGGFEYNTALFLPETAARMAANFSVLLAGIAATPDQMINWLPIMSEQERQLTLIDWNQNDRDYPQTQLIPELFIQRAHEQPDRIALIFNDRELTYRELHQYSNQLAHHLQRLGVTTDVRVGVCMERSLEMIVGLMGILKAGGAYVPLDPAYPSDRLAFMMEDTAAPVLLTQSHIQLPEHNAHIIYMDPGLEEICEESIETPHNPADPESLAYMIYTSGSTGKPKGVAIRHYCTMMLIHWSREVYSDEQWNGVLLSTSINFDISIFEIFCTLSWGGKLILVENALHLMMCKRKDEVVLINTVPSVIRELVKAGAVPASVKTVNLAGEPLPNELVQQIYATGTVDLVWNLYGPSEDTTYSTYTLCARGKDAHVTVGRPLVNTQSYIVDSSLNPVPLGVPGELILGGSSLARGYLNRPELTPDKFIPDPFSGRSGARLYRTGDLVRYLADGSIDFLGRIDHQVKVRGFRIELGEIETVISRHDTVRECVVMAVEERPGVKALVAWVVADDVASFSVDTLRRYMMIHLPDYMIPPSFVVMAAFPLLPNGKINRKLLPSPEKTSNEGAYEAPRTHNEKILATVWSKVLGIERVGIHDNFFELGGDSILSFLIISRSAQEGLALSPKQILKFPTIAELAMVAHSSVAVEAEQGVVTGEVALTAVQHWFFDYKLADPHYWNMAELLKVHRPLDANLLRAATKRIVMHHDSYRLRYEQGEHGWRQHIVGQEESDPFSHEDLAALDSEAQQARLREIILERQASFSLERGPMIRVCYITMGEGKSDRLFLVVHHLAMDGVSWRVLLEDLQTAYEQLEKGDEIHLPAKTTSFKHWAESARKYGSSPTPRKELKYWLGVSRERLAGLPRDFDLGPNTNASERIITLGIDEAKTRALLRDVHEPYRTKINEILLSAMALTLAEWTGTRELVIDLEGHGREDIIKGVDISRTIGWFTAMFPITLDLGADNDLADVIKRVKEQNRKIPQNGVNYAILRYLGTSEVKQQLTNRPDREVIFNYLGQFDGSVSDAATFTFASENKGPDRAPNAARTHLIELNGMVSENCFKIDWHYSVNLHKEETIRDLAGRFIAHLEAIIAHCVAEQVGAYTPADFPLMPMNQSQLDTLIPKLLPPSVKDLDIIQDIYPLTPLQEGILFYAVSNPMSSVYLVQSVWNVWGQMDTERFKEAWLLVVKRHDILRSAFFMDLFKISFQVVYREVELSFELLDWSDVAESEREHRLDGLMQDDGRRVFTPQKPPLMRLTLIRWSETQYQMLWTNHHLILDGWSYGLILKEVFGAYETLSQQGAPRFEPGGSFQDYIHWLESRDREEARTFWHKTLAGFEGPTAFGLDSKSNDMDHELFRTCTLDFSEEISKQLEETARHNQVTINTIVQATWSLLLHRYSGARQVMFGSTVACRPPDLQGSDSMVGMYINTLPLRIDVDNQLSLNQWLPKVQEHFVDVRNFEWAPLVDIRSWGGVLGSVPLFESIIVFENYPVDDSLRADARLLKVSSHKFAEKTDFPLTLFAFVKHDKLSLMLGYYQSRFSAKVIERILGHFEAVVHQFAQAPSSRVSDVSILAADERQQLVFELNRTQSDYPRDQGFHHLFMAHAARTPDAPAVIFENSKHTELTYRQLDERANQVAHYLCTLGVGQESFVGLCMYRSVEMVVGLLGILKAGGAYVPLDPGFPQDRLAYMLEDSGLQVLITEEKLKDYLGEHGASVLLIDTDWGLVEPHVKTDPGVPFDAASRAYVIYTSGSTGKPKGVQIGHQAFTNFIISMAEKPGISAGDRWLAVTTLSFDICGLELWGPLVSGAQIVLASKETAMDGEALLNLLLASNATVMQATPISWRLMLGAGWRPDRKLKMLCGGEPLPGELAAELLAYGDLWNMYGPTETTVWSTLHLIKPKETPISIGRPIANTDIYMIDRRADLVPLGIAGELIIGGEGLARGYHNRADLTAQQFIPNPFSGIEGDRMYKTGDLARYMPSGLIECLGRIDHQVKIRGYRIELGEIEAVMVTHPQIKQAVVVAREDTPGNPVLVAYVMAEDGGAVDVPAVHEFLRKDLPSYMVPPLFVQMDEFPLTPNGKINKKALPAPGAVDKGADEEVVLPGSQLEAIIAGVWKEVLGIENVGVNTQFFELGGNSLSAAKVRFRLKEVLERDIQITDLFQYPTISTLANFLDPDGQRKAAQGRQKTERVDTSDIAVIGMSGRFPGAPNLAVFWDNLVNGVESVSFYSREELLEQGVESELLDDPEYVRATGAVVDEDLFDAHFFGISPREAQVMDPQHRWFLEGCYETLEDAGYDPARYQGRIGVFGGNSMNTYFTSNLMPHKALVESMGHYGMMLANEKDFLTTRVSFKLNLRGPSMVIQTACSTSMVALHMACRNLLDGDCDMALAGGVSLQTPMKNGYLYAQGGTMSPDGHIRPFDKDAGGMLIGNGQGLVLLKRYGDALDEGDNILAIVKGTGVNNDGSFKVGFTAPSVEGQAGAIADALAVSKLNPETITYVEAHGTGTNLGDPIELAGLSRAWREHTKSKQFCALGSAKANIGHLDAAAGISGFIKVVLCLKHKMIPPSINFATPNPDINFDDSPFFVNTKLREWTVDKYVRRAAVSSFGIGGTNAHAILEEAPPYEPAPDRGTQCLLLSAKTPEALEKQRIRLREHLEANADLNMADVAFTLQVGRQEFAQRSAMVCRGREEAIANLANPGKTTFTVEHVGDPKPIIFMFSGQGSQYVNMGYDLYRSERVFRDEVDACAQVLAPHLGLDLRDILYPQHNPEVPPITPEEASKRINQTAMSQPALFVIEYATARLLMSLGIQPTAMVGHSIGEYVAATLAGVITRDDALALVAARGALMQSQPPGGMLALSMVEADVQKYLDDDIQLAVMNAPNRLVVAGPHEALEALTARLKEDGKSAAKLHTSHAFHSAMMDGILDRFIREVRKARLSPPKIPYLSNVSGTWIEAKDALDPTYYARHLRGTVRFADNLKNIFEKENQILIEVGPGKTLMTFAKQQAGRGSSNLALNTIRGPKDNDDDTGFLATTLVQLWTQGSSINWLAYHAQVPRRRVSLPTYPFDRKRFWVDPPKPASEAATVAVAPVPTRVESSRTRSAQPRPVTQKQTDASHWFYQPLWTQTPSAPLFEFHKMTSGRDTWLVFLDYCSLGDQLKHRLTQAGQNVITVRTGEWYAKHSSGGYTLNPSRRSDYRTLFNDLASGGEVPKRVIHLWNVTAERKFQSRGDFANLCMERGFLSLVYLAQAYEDLGISDMLHVGVLSNNMQEVTDGDLTMPEKATLLGACRVIPREYPHMNIRSIDVVIPSNEKSRSLLVDQLLGELAVTSSDTVIAYRGRRRWLQTFESTILGPVNNTSDRLRKGGVYLITGGMGGIGTVLSKHLAEYFGARIALVSRTPIPNRSDWDHWLATHAPQDPTSLNIRHLFGLERAGAKVLGLTADVTNLDAMRQAVNRAEREFGRINGVIHAAGVAPSGPIRNITREKCMSVLAPKVSGTLVLDELFRERDLDFLLLLSSTSSILGHYGNADYCAGNAFLDAFAHHHNAHSGFNIIAINSDPWRDAGMACIGDLPTAEKEKRKHQIDMMLTNEEGIEGIRRILAGDMYSQIVFATRNILTELDKVHRFEIEHLAEEINASPSTVTFVSRPPEVEQAPPAVQTRPLEQPDVQASLMQPVASKPKAAPAASNDTEEKVRGLWQESLGIASIKPGEDFTELGGDSLLATMIASRLRRIFKVNISPNLFNEEPTIAGMTRAIDKLLGHDGRTAESNPEPAPTTAAVSPSSPTENEIARVWCDLLELTSVSVEDEFSALGGDASQALQAAQALERSFGVEVTPQMLTEKGSLRALAERIDTLRWALGSLIEAQAGDKDDDDDEEFEL